MGSSLVLLSTSTIMLGVVLSRDYELAPRLGWPSVVYFVYTCCYVVSYRISGLDPWQPYRSISLLDACISLWIPLDFRSIAALCW